MPLAVIDHFSQKGYAACCKQYPEKDDGFITEHPFGMKFFSFIPFVEQGSGKNSGNDADNNIRGII